MPRTRARVSQADSRAPEQGPDCGGAWTSTRHRPCHPHRAIPCRRALDGSPTVLLALTLPGAHARTSISRTCKLCGGSSFLFWYVTQRPTTGGWNTTRVVLEVLAARCFQTSVLLVSGSSGYTTLQLPMRSSESWVYFRYPGRCQMRTAEMTAPGAPRSSDSQLYGSKLSVDSIRVSLVVSPSTAYDALQTPPSHRVDADEE